ncbi:hypothetical protein [Aliivibrio kagoshimensis]|uniref:hypothetical protein n=1 Tax=Aliivibrio kagoshimensis TaxID=2910230 RepID=UPI003D102C3B
MVYFILSRKGYLDLETEFSGENNSFWISGNILSRNEIEILWKNNVSLTVFSDEISFGCQSEIEDALREIKAHHPNQTIWTETKITNNR